MDKSAINADVHSGQSYPLGATIRPDGVNFSVYSTGCERMELLLFDRVDDTQPARIISLDSNKGHRTRHYWHALVPGIATGQIYAYRAFGPFEPEQGLRYDAQKVLLDPYGRGVAVPDVYCREAGSQEGDNTPVAMKSVVVDLGDYDWEDDAPPITHIPGQLSTKCMFVDLHATRVLA